MSANTSLAQRIGRVLERVTRQSGRLPETPAYGSLLLGRVSESQGRRRVRIQIIMTVLVLGANLIGIAVALFLVTVAIPVPSVFDDAPAWITFGASPAYIVAASAWGTYWITRRTVIALRWAIEEREPTPEDERNTFVAPWRIALVDLVLWGVGTILLTTLYGMVNTLFIPRFLLVVSFGGVVVATASYLLAEFALRPVAAQALEAGPPPRRFAAGIMGRTMVVWFLGSAVPVIGIMMLALFELVLRNLTQTQFAVAVLIVSMAPLIFGCVLMWILAWLTATPVRVVRAALARVERGDLRGTSWCSTVPNSVSCNAASTRWSTACGSGNASATSSAATSGVRWRWPRNANGRSWAAKNATSRSSSSTSWGRRSW